MSDDEQARWRDNAFQSKLDFFHNSNRAAIDIGIAGLNAITLLNGGAVVALIAFVGQVLTEGKEGGAHVIREIIYGGLPFGVGVATSAISYFLAYFYQSAVTWGIYVDIQGHNAGRRDEQKFVSVTRWQVGFKYVMVGSACLSVVFFLWGATRVALAFLDFLDAHQ